jgi:hypothetical protein
VSYYGEVCRDYGFCLAGHADRVICPNDSCDIEDGVRPNPRDNAKAKISPSPEANMSDSETTDESDLASQALMAATWVTCSPHEWVWTQEQQVAMARFCLSAAGVIGEAISDLERIAYTAEPDAGVILFSVEGGSHYDDEAGCEVYDHEHFSPLGDALLALYVKLSSISYRMSPAAIAKPAIGLTEEGLKLLKRIAAVSHREPRTSMSFGKEESEAAASILARSASADVVGVRREEIEAAALSGYRLGHHHTVEGGYQWCEQGGREAVEEIVAEAEAALASQPKEKNYEGR